MVYSSRYEVNNGKIDIHYLLDQMADQHIKEVLVAYFILLSSGEECDPCQHDIGCHIGQGVEFATSAHAMHAPTCKLQTRIHTHKVQSCTTFHTCRQEHEPGQVGPGV